MTELAIKIKTLRDQGYTIQKISDTLGCAKSTIGYHIGGEKQRINYYKRNLKFLKKQHPYYRKLRFFLDNKPSDYEVKYAKRTTKNTLLYNKIRRFSMPLDRHKRTGIPEFSVDDVIKKFGENPKCYLTGRQINIYDTKSYHFDHIIPKSRGGDNTISNLGIACKEANKAKNDMTENEFILLCKEILEYQGYTIIPENGAGS